MPTSDEQKCAWGSSGPLYAERRHGRNAPIGDMPAQLDIIVFQPLLRTSARSSRRRPDIDLPEKHVADFRNSATI